jgi:GTP-binding protein Era
MIDATDPKIGEEPAHDDVLVTVNRIRKPLFLIINKSDLVKKSDVLPIIDFYSKARSFDEIFPISALKLEGTAELVKSIVAILPRHPPLYPLDIISEQNERFFVSEIIREKVFEKYQQEIPYSTTVEIVDFKEREGGKTFISANIHVERESQKGILIGRKGGALKQVGLLARKSIEAFLQQAVFLELHVKVQRDWRGDKEWLARLGYKHEQ